MTSTMKVSKNLFPIDCVMIHIVLEETTRVSFDEFEIIEELILESLMNLILKVERLDCP